MFRSLVRCCVPVPSASALSLMHAILPQHPLQIVSTTLDYGLNSLFVGFVSVCRIMLAEELAVVPPGLDRELLYRIYQRSEISKTVQATRYHGDGRCFCVCDAETKTTNSLAHHRPSPFILFSLFCQRVRCALNHIRMDKVIAGNFLNLVFPVRCDVSRGIRMPIRVHLICQAFIVSIGFSLFFLLCLIMSNE